jgi:hypothetical protein
MGKDYAAHIVPSSYLSPQHALETSVSLCRTIWLLLLVIDKLTVNKFFEYYSELRDYYQYLAVKYHFDLSSFTVDPVTGEIVPIKDKDKFYFDKMAI